MPFFLNSCLKLRKNKHKKNKKVNQCIRPFRDITTQRIDNAIQHCEAQPSFPCSSNLNQYDEMANPEHLVGNSTSVNETSENLEQDLEENDTDDGNNFDSKYSEDFENNSELHMTKIFHLKVLDETSECGVFRCDSKHKCRKKEHDIDDDKSKKDENRIIASNLNEDYDMKCSDHTIASSTSESESTENSEKSVQERNTEDIGSYDEISSQNSENSDNNSQGSICADFHSNDSERTAFNAFGPEKDTFERITTSKATTDYQNSNELLAADQGIETITVTRRLAVTVPDDILENIYIEKSYDIINNITINSDVVGIIEELNTIDNAIKKLHEQKELEEPKHFVHDVDVAGTQDKNVDSHKSFSNDSNISESSLNKESQPPICSKRTLPSLLKSVEKQDSPLNNMTIEDELKENLDICDSSVLLSNSSFVNSNRECPETDDHVLTVQMERSKVIFKEMAKHRRFNDSDSGSEDFKSESEVLEVDSTDKKKEKCDTVISEVSIKNFDSNSSEKEVVINSNSENFEDKIENTVHPNIKIHKSGKNTDKNDSLIINIVEYASVNNDKFISSKVEEYCRTDFKEDCRSNNSLDVTQANSELNIYLNATHNAETSKQSIYPDVNVKLEKSKSHSYDEGKFTTETSESQTVLSADLKERIDLSVYKAPESFKSEILSNDKIPLFTEETITVQDTRAYPIPEKQAQIIYLIHSNMKSDELPIYKIFKKPAECDNVKSHPGCSEADGNFIEMQNCVISSKSETNRSSIPRIPKIYSEMDLSDDIFKDTDNTNGLFEANGKGDSSGKHDENSKCNLKSKDNFTCSIENECNKLRCKQKEKLDSIFQPSKNETHFMNTNENFKDYQCKESSNAEKLIFDSNLKKVGTQGVDECDTGRNGGFIPISLKSAGDISDFNMKDLENCETILHNVHDKSFMLDKQDEKTVFENKIFDESFDDNDRNMVCINDNKYSQAHSDHFKDSSEGKTEKMLQINFPNSYSVQETQNYNASRSEKANEMLQNSADSLSVNDEYNQDNNVLSEDSLEKISIFEKSDETVSPCASKEQIISQSQNAYFNSQILNAESGVSTQSKPGNFRIDFYNSENKEKHTDDAVSYRNKTTVCTHSSVDLDNGNSPYLVKQGSPGNCLSKIPEYNNFEKDLSNKIMSQTLKNDNRLLISENNRRMKPASKCCLLESCISSESSKSESKDVKKQELKSESIEMGAIDFIGTRGENNAHKETLSDNFETLLKFNRNRQKLEKSTKLKNTLTIQKVRNPKQQIRQKLENRNTKLRLQKAKDEKAKNGIMHNKHNKINTNLQTKECIITKDSFNINTFSRCLDDKTESIDEQSSLVENKVPGNSVQSDYFSEVKVESLKEYCIPMTPVRRKILHSSRSIRSPKYPSPLKSKRSNKKESHTLKHIFLKSTKQKDVANLMFSERNVHKLKDGLEMCNLDFRNIKTFSPRKKLMDDGQRHQIQHTHNYRATSPSDLKSKFDDVFKEYAGKGRCNRNLISFQRSTKLLQDAGVIGKKLTADDAADAFKSFAGVKVTLNKDDYRLFLKKLTRKKGLNYNEVYEKLCQVSNKEMV